MTSKVNCGLLVNPDSDETSFLFTIESDGQLDRDVNVQNKLGNSIVAVSLSTSEAIGIAKQIQTQYLEWSQEKLEKDRKAMESIKKEAQKRVSEDSGQNADTDKGNDGKSGKTTVEEHTEGDSEGTDDSSAEKVTDDGGDSK